MRKFFLIPIILLITACEEPAPKATQPKVQPTAEKAYDFILSGGTIVDGLGNAAFSGDVGIKDDRIVTISKGGLNADEANSVVDISGLVVSPGFIDNHSHTQVTIHKHPLAENFTRQGITTLIASLHSGEQPWPLDDYASALEIAPNMGFFAGHTWTRRQVLGLENRAPTEDELQEMRDLVDETMKQGALGLSTGLLYVPANYAAPEEVIELAKVAARHGGIYVTHMRNEGTGLLDSINETIRVAEEAGIPAQINHHKANGAGQWGMSVQSLALIDAANARGLDVRHDLYPYPASSTSSAILFPQWVHAGGPEEFAKRVNDPEQLPAIKTEMKRIFLEERTGADLSRLQFRVLKSDPSYNGKTLADMAADRGMANNVETGIELAIELQLKGGFSAIYHAMDEADVIRIMQHPLAMIETDGDPVSYGVGYPHPRSYGAFPRVLARYVRELKVLTLEEAVMKMTSMPADQYNQPLRGRIIEGAFADLVVFDPDTVQDQATFTDPHRYPTGIHHVIVNGTFVIKAGALTGERPGVWIKGPARPERVAANVDADKIRRNWRPAWTPDGEHILFSSKRDGNYEIYKMKRDGAQQTNITKSAQAELFPAVSSAGDKIAFVGEKEGNYDIYVMDIDGTNQVRLTDQERIDDWPSWRDEDQTIIFDMADNDDYAILKMNADGSDQAIIVDNAGRTVDPMTADASDWVVYSSDEIEPEGINQIFAFNLTTNETRQLTRGDLNHRAPALSTSGNMVIFSAGNDEYSHLFSMEMDGSGLTQLTAGPYNDYWPAYSPDDLEVAFTSDRAANVDIYVMNSDGSNIRQLTGN